jgi:hypothetical protein
MYLFSTPDSERFAFLVVGGQSGFAACPPLRKLLKSSGEQALRPDFISFLGVLNNYQIINKSHCISISPGDSYFSDFFME